MDKLNETTWEADMLQAVDRNHRRAVARAAEPREQKEKVMPMWACLLWIVIMAAIAAACVVYAAV